MFKKLTAFVMALCVVGGTALYAPEKPLNIITASAEEEYTKVTEGSLTFKVYADDAEVSECDESAEGEIIVPAEINGVPVTSIGKRAFYKCTGLTSINIPESVTSIGDNAFWRCTGLTSINIPDGVTSIESNVFSNCESLTSINIPDSVTSIKNGAFLGCTELTSINIPESITKISGWTFSGCENLTSIILPDNITSIENCTFANCKKITSINIPDSVTNIGDSAFSGCTELTSINIPDSVTNIFASAFNYTKWLENKRKENPLVIVNDIIIDGQTYTENTLNIPENIKIIASGAFKGTNLTSINFPDSMTNISGGAFLGCESLASITIPYNITSIGSSAFSNCTNLTDITISNPNCEIYYSEHTISNRTVSKQIESVDSEGNVISHGWTGGEFDGTIHGYANSTAQAYAEKYGYKFAVIGDESPAEYVAGDANLDGNTTISDAVRILQYVSNNAKYPLDENAMKNADVYNVGDGVTGMDAAAIQRLDAGVISSLPESVMEK